MAYVCVDGRLVRFAYGENRKRNGKLYPMRIEICEYECSNDTCPLVHPNRHGVVNVDVNTRYCFNGCRHVCMFPRCEFNHHRTCDGYIEWYDPRAPQYERKVRPCSRCAGDDADTVQPIAMQPQYVQPQYVVKNRVPTFNEENFPAIRMNISRGTSRDEDLSMSLSRMNISRETSQQYA